MTLLNTSGLSASYGQIEALRGVDLYVDAGEVVCLIGANGAGKTTLMRSLIGLLPARRGSIQFEGRSIERWPSHRRIAAGMMLVPEGRGILAGMSVEENLLMGLEARLESRRSQQRAAALDEIFQRFPVLAERRHVSAGLLSGGEQQMLAIGRALLAKPRLLMLDEPSLGLAPLLVKQVFEVIVSLRRQGQTVLVVEQNARQALRIADRGYVLETGRIVASGPAAELRASERVRAAYLGGSA